MYMSCQLRVKFSHPDTRLVTFFSLYRNISNTLVLSFFLFFSLSKKKSCAAHVSTNICDVMHVSDWYNHVFLPLWLSIFFFLRFGYGNESYDYCVCNVVLSFPLPFVALVGFFLFSIYLFLRQFEGKVKSA